MKLLTEKIEVVSVYGTSIKVFINPSFAEMKLMPEARGIIDDRNNLYVFDARAANHDQVQKELGLSHIKEYLALEPEIVFTGGNIPEDELKKIYTLRRAYNNQPFNISTDRHFGELLVLESKKLTEGLRAKDLKDLVLPLISVDEYVSRVTDKAIVIGFLVHDKDAADDLNRFIQKSAITLLDTDVSPAPDQHGYYYVFVEIMNDAKFSKAVDALIKEVSPLVDITNWKMRARKTKSLLPYSEHNLTKAIERANRLKEEKIYEFFKDSCLNDLVIEDSTIKMNEAIEFELCDFGKVDKILAENNLLDKPVKLTFHEAVHTNKLSKMLGEGWVVDLIEDTVLLQNVNSDLALLLVK